MSTKTGLPTHELFGLKYWPALPAFLISTIDGEEKPHVAPYSLVFFPSYTNVTQAGDTPKIISLVIGDYETFAGARQSRTFQNILSSETFVVNVPTATIVKQLNTTVFPAADKFEASGLTPERSLKVRAPSVAECPINFECELLRIEDNRWLGELIYGRIIAARVDSQLQKMPEKEIMSALEPVYHFAYDHFNGTYFSLGNKILEELDAPDS